MDWTYMFEGRWSLGLTSDTEIRDPCNLREQKWRIFQRKLETIV